MHILPSFLENVEQEGFDKKFFSNVTLKVGQIMRINYPDTSDKNASQVTTYDIFINESSLDGESHSVIYGAISSNVFGGLADYCDYTLRPNVQSDGGKENQQILLSGAPITKDDYPKVLGCTVIVACINGSPADSVIIGAIPHYLNSIANEKTYKIPTKDSGHFLNFVFNGIKVNINKDGELFVQRYGATQSDGSIKGASSSEQDENLKKANSFVKINKDGEIILSTTSKENAEDISNDDLDNSVVIDKEGNINIKIKNGQTLELKDKDGDTKFTLGDGAKSAAVAEPLKQLYDQLKQKLDIFDNHTHSTGMGPSGPPTPTVGAPGWSDDIVSKSMKIPK